MTARAMPIGLIAGNGTFPFLVLRAARQLGHDVTVVAHRRRGLSRPRDAGPRSSAARPFDWVPLGQLGTCIDDAARRRRDAAP